MIVSTSKGDFECKSVQEILSYLQNEREIWVSGNEKYPCLAICVNGQFSAITYFENEDGEMWLSYNEDGNQEVSFIAGGEEWVPDACTVLSYDDAVSCIKEFSITHKRPSCIKWQEL